MKLSLAVIDELISGGLRLLFIDVVDVNVKGVSYDHGDKRCAISIFVQRI
ncbi:MAG: hypothetical protein ACJA0C_000443 [Candidatus Endobugula sp.]|jgi:hypothetical protein